jgi:hypothetical protein
MSNEDLIELLMREENYMESGCRTRVSQSRRLITNGRAKDALLIVANSARVPGEISTAARRLAHSLQR